MEETQKTVELKKHVAVIHSSNKLSLLQRKIANALLFNAYPQLMEKDEHEIHIATLCQLIGYDSHDYKTIKKSLVNLLSTVLEWNLVDGDKLEGAGVWSASSIIADASIKGPVCTYSYSNKMRQLLHRPHVYGRLDMLVQAKFQSGYGLALYENCNRYQDIGQSPWIDIRKFRKLMGVEEGKYAVFRDFKNRVLDKAVQEVNQYSSLIVEPLLRRENQKVVAIQFVIKKTNTTDTADAITDVLKNRFGFSKRQIEQSQTLYQPDYIREKIAVIESSASFKAGKIKNLAKYLLSALKEDYQPTKVSHAPVRETSNLLEFSEHTLQQQERELAYQRFSQRAVLQQFNQQETSLQTQILKHFDVYLSKNTRGMYHDIFLRDGLENPLLHDPFYDFVKNDKKANWASLLTFNEWMTHHDNAPRARAPRKRAGR